MNTYEYNVCSAYVPYLINGELSDLEDWEIKRLEEFDKYVQEEHGVGHWSFDPDIEPKFCYCDVTDTKANCVEMDWIVMGEKHE